MSQRRKKQKRAGQGGGAVPSLSCIEPNAAGIDVGATEIFVAVPQDRDPSPVRSFETFTEDLHRLKSWLQQCGITTVAMESTGVYWIPLFQILEKAGMEVCLVNAQHVKHVPGRKSDVIDCQWLQYLHSVGLLRASFRPEERICAIRSLLRHRDSLVQMAAAHVLHMQKALTQMNLQLHHVLSDITGQSGLAILDAILAGERNPAVLAPLRHARVQARKRSSRNHWWETIRGNIYSPCGSPCRPIVTTKACSPPATRRLRNNCRTWTAELLRMHPPCHRSAIPTGHARMSFALTCAANCIGFTAQI